MLFQKLLQKVIHDGNVRLIDSRGRIYDYGNGTGRRCTLKLHNRRLEWKLVLNPPLYLGEAYMDGEITLEEGTLRDFIALLDRNYPYLESNPLVKLGFALGGHVRRLKQYNTIAQAQKHAADHHNLSGKTSTLFIDADRPDSRPY